MCKSPGGLLQSLPSLKNSGVFCELGLFWKVIVLDEGRNLYVGLSVGQAMSLNNRALALYFPDTAREKRK